MGHGEGKGQFSLRGRVLTFVTLDLLFQGRPVGLLPLVEVGGAGFESHVVGRGDGCQR